MGRKVERRERREESIEWVRVLDKGRNRSLKEGEKKIRRERLDEDGMKRRRRKEGERKLE